MFLSDLPLELLLQVLLELPSTDLLLSVRLTCRYLHNVIRDSVKLQYLISARLAAVVDNPMSSLVLAERLEALRRHEHAWSNFVVGKHTNIPVRHHSSGLYDFSAGIYVLGEGIDGPFEYPTIALRYISLSGDPSFQPGDQWARISVDRHIMDFGLAVLEHDLIAIVTS